MRCDGIRCDFGTKGQAFERRRKCALKRQKRAIGQKLNDGRKDDRNKRSDERVDDEKKSGGERVRIEKHWTGSWSNSGGRPRVQSRKRQEKCWTGGASITGNLAIFVFLLRLGSHTRHTCWCTHEDEPKPVEWASAQKCKQLEFVSS